MEAINSAIDATTIEPTPRPHCNRCGKRKKAGWEEMMCNGEISLSRSGSLFTCLTGQLGYSTGIEAKIEQNMQSEGHPAIKEGSHAQNHALAWGKGEVYQLCMECQDVLISTIGAFFRLPERKEQWRKALQPKPDPELGQFYFPREPERKL